MKAPTKLKHAVKIFHHRIQFAAESILHFSVKRDLTYITTFAHIVEIYKFSKSST